MIFLVACSSIAKKEYTNTDGKIVVEEWYNKTNMKSRTTFLSRDSSAYIFISFYENSEMKDSARYVNNLVDGLKLFYDKQGDLLHFENYSDGILNGSHKALYSNGISSFEGYHINGNKVGEWQFHYPDGRPITYEFYDSTGKIIYFRKYNEFGEYTNSKGTAIIKVSTSQNSNLGDTTLMYLVIANPPGCELNLIINGADSKELYNKKVNTVNTICPLIFTEKGKKVLDIQLNVMDIKSDLEENHSKNFEFILQ